MRYTDTICYSDKLSIVFVIGIASNFNLDTIRLERYVIYYVRYAISKVPFIPFNDIIFKMIFANVTVFIQRLSQNN